MAAKGSSVLKRSTSDRMKISSLLNEQTLPCPQNVLASPHKLRQGHGSVRFLAVNNSTSSVHEDGKFTPPIDVEEPSSASFQGRERCVASQDESAATSEDTWPASGRRRDATAITGDKNPGARSKRRRGANEALEIERHLVDIPKLETTQSVVVTPPVHPSQKRGYTKEETHFIWYYHVVLLEKWEDIHKSFNDNFTSRSDPSCLRDKLRQLVMKGDLPARPKKDHEQTHNGEAGQAISHAAIEDVLQRCASLGYLWMKEASRIAGSQTTQSVMVRPTIRPRKYTEEEVHFIWYYRVALSKNWRNIHKNFNHRFNPRRSSSCLHEKLRQLVMKGDLPDRPKKDHEQTHDGEAGQAISHANIEEVLQRCASLGYPWMEEAS
ncbi:hypothetical protein DTO013E5_10115 [Penicillium roqueforti]|uniref:Uncharacterized protein n=3 Tax=Penicillium TaxID=5073 RepID=A0A1V6XMC0_PENNA|nr:hypothetical protein DTO013F2_10163 [Penicillium roqueforti]OQE76196.1 hypothetical protein PENNAL_c0069G07700 [Penicillium nalgiovense]CAG7952151.1 unnamed protein product [Penicillium salamii]CRL30752.1 unnamed protein product [Penicillium camemberti]KAI2736242.1 hypothetical protein DTO012A1_8573 [Penicillium roqueforti]